MSLNANMPTRQQHFLDLCELLNQPKPASANTGAHFLHLREKANPR